MRRLRVRAADSLRCSSMAAAAESHEPRIKNSNTMRCSISEMEKDFAPTVSAKTWLIESPIWLWRIIRSRCGLGLLPRRVICKSVSSCSSAWKQPLALATLKQENESRFTTINQRIDGLEVAISNTQQATTLLRDDLRGNQSQNQNALTRLEEMMGQLLRGPVPPTQ